MSGQDDLDLYGAEATPGRTTPGIWLVRVAGVLAGAVITFCGVAFYMLRCFDSCPSDPSLDKSIQLLTAALAVFGLVVAIACASAGTRWATGAAAVVAALGGLIAVAGAVTLALVPSVNAPGGGGGTAPGGALALVGGAVIAVVAFLRFIGGTQPRD